ncbi:hypothetical protein [Streptomyces agglomeratus]|uniref:hypothetical protein n=1 Tax=Streptomyces agglomeratus TaxID=285458 RepID=UPI000854C7AF|nr:hypothetical protein [Streptomyces agglomeratus]OEJ36510.1 hypothetical protein BGK72_38065 [Streptomyces agglomeratus]
MDFDFKPFKVGDTVLVAIEGRIREGEVKLAAYEEVVVAAGTGFHVIRGEYRKNEHGSIESCWFNAVARRWSYLRTFDGLRLP